jgi:hypothetical protein
MNHRYNSPFFNSEFKFLLMHELNFHVTGFSYGSNTHDVVGRFSRDRADFDVATTAASSWILAATSSSRASMLEFQHSSPTFETGILAAAMGTSNWRASPTVGNAFVDDTNAVAAFFFTTDGKTYTCAFQFLYS